MKGPTDYGNTNRPKDWWRDEAVVMPAAMLFFFGCIILSFLGVVFYAYAESYNKAMVNCLAEHSKDICVETLR